MKCPKCLFENPEGFQFCGNCGRELGKPLEAEEAILITDSERKRVTALFSDLSGYTAMTEKLDPEEVKEITSSIFDGIRDVVGKYEGFIERFSGDGVLILFGVPKAHEDDPIRAIKAAREIHELVDSISPSYEHKVGRPLSMHSGVNTGLAVTADVIPEKGTQGITGIAINVAARLSDLAVANEILVGLDTQKTAKTHFTFQPLKAAKVKGKSERIPIYKVVSEKAATARLSQEMQVSSQMVGRDQELAKLELQVMKAINGEGSIVTIIGEAGIGKSRLVAELKKRDVIKRVTLLEGRAISMGRNLSFHPIIDLLKQWAGIREDDGEAAALGKLETAVRGVCREDVYEILPFVATLMGMKLSGRYAERIKGIEGEALEKLILKNVRDLLIASAKLTPLVLVMEDFHWADTSTMELVVSLFRLVETQSILFVNVARPDYKESLNRAIETIKEKLPVYHVEIELEPLDKGMSETLITNMLNIKGIHHTVIRRIVERSGGNPFFIEEVVQSFIDEGAVTLKSGTYGVTDKIGEIAVPHTINDVLMARIDGLEGKTRNLVKIASVIGRNFFYRVLVDVASTVVDIDVRLSRLKDVGLIRERRRMDEVEYLFKHALVQEAAYESIIHRKRKELHLRVARSIEKVFGDRLHEFYGMLAYHYSRADDLDKTKDFLIKAGEEALKSSASNEALHYYRKALDLYLKKHGDTAVPEKVAMLEKNIALALYNRGQYEEAIEYFDKALNYYWGKLPEHRISAALKSISAIFHLLITLYIRGLKFKRIPTNRDIEAIDLFHKKCKALGTVDPKRFFFEFLYMYKRVTNYDLTNFDLGLEIYMEASSLFSFSGMFFRFSRKILDFAKVRVRRDNAKIFINYDFLETIHNYFQGNWKEINEYDADIVNSNLNMGEIWNVSQNLFWHGASKIYQGSLDMAGGILSKLDDIVNVYENDFSLLLRFELNIILLIEYRKLDEALNEIEEAINIVQKANFNMYLFDLYSYKAWIYILKRDMEKAEKYIGYAFEIRSEVNAIPIILATFCRSRLELYLYRFKESVKTGNKSESIKYRKKVNKSSKMLLRVSKRVALHRTESYKLRGVYYWSIKKQKKARKMWQKAIKEGERLGALLELSRTYFEVGKRLLEPESKYKELNDIKAEIYLEKARGLFEEMDMQCGMDELNRIARASHT